MSEPTTTDRVICNPVDLAYRYQYVRTPSGSASVHREGADPSVVRYRDRFYLFASMTDGFWHSDDLVSWTFRRSDVLPALDYAPDARVIDGRLVVTASRDAGVCPFFATSDPLGEGFSEVSPGDFAFWDPNLFQDDDGRVYLYWGCSSTDPLHGAEVDPTSFTRVGDTIDLIADRSDRHGWERSGENHRLAEPVTDEDRLNRELFGGRPFIEGAWMTKHADRYYLQYAAPATEFNTYADGVYVADSPLGPMTYSASNPFSFKPGGFITGAGHGSTFQDAHGNWWHAATMRISVNHQFERRIGLFPAGFDEDGVLFCNQEFADYPMRVPDGPFDPWTGTSTGWMLLSYQAAVESSSDAPHHPAALAVDEDVRTWWTPQSSEPGEWLAVDLGEVESVRAIQVNLADEALLDVVDEPATLAHVGGMLRAIDPADHTTELVVEISVDGVEWSVVSEPGGDRPHQLIVTNGAREARFVRVTAGEMPYGGPVAISGVRVFGHRQDGEAPGAATPRVQRQDPQEALLEWDGVDGAVGYNVRYGIAPDKLYHSWLLYGQTRLELRALDAETDYWVAVDAFNASGITRGSAAAMA